MLTSFEIAKEAQRHLHKASGDIAWARSATMWFEHSGGVSAFAVAVSGYHCALRFDEKDLGLTLDQFGKRFLRPMAIAMDDHRAKAAA